MSIARRLRALAGAPAPWLFLLLLATYSLTLSGDFMISDGEVVFQAAVALADGGELALECNPGLPQIVPGVGGQCFSKYGLGMPLLAAGAYKVGRLLAGVVAAPGVAPIAIGHLAVAYLNVVITAATGVVLYWLARDLYQSRWLGLILALVYGLATSAWPYTKVFFSEPLIGLLTLVAAYALYRLDVRARRAPAWAALAGLALGFAVLTKVAAAILLPLFGLYLLWRLRGAPALGRAARPAPVAAVPAPLAPEGGAPAPSNFVRIGPRLARRQAQRRPSRGGDPEAINRFPVPLRRRGEALAARAPAPAPPPPAPAAVPLPRSARALVARLVPATLAFVLPLAGCAALLLWHNAARFGSPLNSGYSDEGFTTPLYVGLYGLLFSSGKSIFLYAPPVLLGLPGLAWLWRRRPAEALLAGGVGLVTLLYSAAWWAWYGGWSWGPRFLVPVLPLLILPIGAVLLARGWARWALALLAAAGVAVQALGVLIDFNAYIDEITGGDPANEYRYLFLPWLSPLIGHLRYLVKGQHLAVAAFDMTRLGLRPVLAMLYPVAAVGLLAAALVALAVIFRPPARHARLGDH
jgi:hypothetical protein